MMFHFPSFLLGVLFGGGGVAIAPRLRPLLVELAAVGWRLVENVRVRAARSSEDLQDLMAEARARARGFRSSPRATT